MGDFELWEGVVTTGILVALVVTACAIVAGVPTSIDDAAMRSVTACMNDRGSAHGLKPMQEVFNECYQDTKGGKRRAPSVRPFDPNHAD